MSEITRSIPDGEITSETEFVFVAGQAFVNAAKHEQVVDMHLARVADLEAELDVYDERENSYVARVAELEAELAKLKEQWEFAAKAQVERSETAEAEAERLRIRLRTIVTEWQLRCAALANGEKP